MDDQEVIRLWQEAIKLIGDENYMSAFEHFELIEDPPNAIIFNAAVLQMIGEYYEEALENFTECLSRDPHLIVGYFLRGLTAYYNKQFAAARDDFEEARIGMRDAKFINYGPLGMELALCEFQVLGNLSMLNLILDLDINKSRSLMEKAAESKAALAKDSAASNLLAEALKVELPKFDTDLIDRCRDLSCPLLTLEPLPIFKPRGVAATLLQEKPPADYLATNQAKVLYASSALDDFTGFGGKHNLDNLRPLYRRFGRNRLKRKPKTIEKLIRACSPIVIDIGKPRVCSPTLQSPGNSRPSTPSNSQPSTPTSKNSLQLDLRPESLRSPRPESPRSARPESLHSPRLVFRQNSRPSSPILGRGSPTTDGGVIPRPSTPSGRRGTSPRPLSFVRPHSPSSPLPLARAGSMPSLAHLDRSAERPQSPAFGRPMSPLVRETVDGRRGSRPGTPGTPGTPTTAFNWDLPGDPRLSLAQRQLARQGRWASAEVLNSPPTSSRSNSLTRDGVSPRNDRPALGVRASYAGSSSSSSEDVSLKADSLSDEESLEIIVKGKKNLAMVRPTTRKSSSEDNNKSTEKSSNGKEEGVEETTWQEVFAKMASLGNNCHIHFHFNEEVGKELKNDLKTKRRA